MNKNTTILGFWFLLYKPLPDAPRVGYRRAGGHFTMHNLYFFNRAILWHRSV